MADTNVREASLSMKSAEKSAPAAGSDAADRLITKPIPSKASQHDAPDTLTKERISCWCHASPAGNQLYLKNESQALGSDDYDLGEFGIQYMYSVHGIWR